MNAARSIRPPGDKSITHLAFLLAGLMRCTSGIGNSLASADTRTTAKVLRQLGVTFSPLRQSHPVRVRGAKWSAPKSTLHCGNSDTTARLLCGALAGHRFETRVDGDSSLRRRPMTRVTGPLVQMGAKVRGEHGETLPLSIRGGSLRAIDYEGTGASAQVKSAILFAGLVAQVPVSITEPNRTNDHTERLFRFVGADIKVNGSRVELSALGDVLRTTGSLELNVPGDPSSAAFLSAAAILTGTDEIRLDHVCVNQTRTGFIDIMRRMGAKIRIENERECCGEPVADLVVGPARLSATEVTQREVPGTIDEFPILAVMAARAEGETVFRSLGELRAEESDRRSSIAENLRRLGVECEVSGDDLYIIGTDRPLRGRVDTRGDHRISMAFAVLAAAPGVDLELSETASTGTCYPRFFEVLQSVRGNG